MDPFNYRDTCSTVGAAAREGDCELLYKLIQERRPIDVRDNRGWSPLHEAAAHNSSKCLKVLLAFMEDKEDINLQTHEGETPLFLTAMSNCDESMKVLLENGANVNIANNQDQTPLMKLLCKSVVNPLCLELLIQYGADVNAQMWNGWTALHEAACRGNASVIKRLLQEGTNLHAEDDYNIQPVFTAAKNGQVECLKLLLEAGADPNSRTINETSVLFVASQENYPECVKILLSHGARTDLTVGGYATPLHVAAWRGNIKCMEILDPLTEPCRRNYTPLHHAAQNGQLEAVKFLIANGHDKENGIKVDADTGQREECLDSYKPEPPLYCALEERELPVAEHLLSLELTESFNCSGLHCPLIISFPHIGSLDLLLRYGANVNCGHMRIFRHFLINWDQCKLATKFLLDRGMKEELGCKINYLDRCKMEMIRDPKDFVKFVRLLHHYTPNIKICRHAVASLDAVGLMEGIRELTENPHSLQSLCRLQIRKLIGPKKLNTEDWVDSLPVPPPLKDILLFKDLILEDDRPDDLSADNLNSC